MDSPKFFVCRADPLDPASALQFFPPKGSDELHEALKATYPHLTNLQARMRQAAIEFFLQEQEQDMMDQFSSPTVSDHTTPEYISYNSMTPFTSSMSFPNTPVISEQTSPEYISYSTASIPSDLPPLFPQVSHTSQSSASTSPKVEASSSVPKQEDLTSVWALPSKPDAKIHKRRCMTAAEKSAYKAKRLEGACADCKRRRRKCKHSSASSSSSSPSSITKSSITKSTSHSLSSKSTIHSSGRIKPQKHGIATSTEYASYTFDNIQTALAAQGSLFPEVHDFGASELFQEGIFDDELVEATPVYSQEYVPYIPVRSHSSRKAATSHTASFSAQEYASDYANDFASYVQLSDVPGQSQQGVSFSDGHAVPGLSSGQHSAVFDLPSTRPSTVSDIPSARPSTVSDIPDVLHSAVSDVPGVSRSKVSKSRIPARSKVSDIHELSTSTVSGQSGTVHSTVSGFSDVLLPPSLSDVPGVLRSTASTATISPSSRTTKVLGTTSSKVADIHGIPSSAVLQVPGVLSVSGVSSIPGSKATTTAATAAAAASASVSAAPYGSSLSVSSSRLSQSQSVPGVLVKSGLPGLSGASHEAPATHMDIANVFGSVASTVIETSLALAAIRFAAQSTLLSMLQSNSLTRSPTSSVESVHSVNRLALV